MTESSQRMGWPYPSQDQDPWYSAFQDFVNGIDASGYAAREDRHIILIGGGTVSWDLATKTLSWSESLRISAPITGFTWVLSPGNVTLDEGEVFYVKLNRAPLANDGIVAYTGQQLPSDDLSLAIAVRYQDRVWLRTGVSLGDGDSLFGFAITVGTSGTAGGDLSGAYPNPSVVGLNGTPLGTLSPGTGDVLSWNGTQWVNQPPAGIGDIRGPAIVVGNQAAGDTTNNCDYLDPGDGSGIAAAIAAASGKDVYIRPGTYIITGTNAPFVVPNGTRVIGAGNALTVLQNDQVDKGVFLLGNDCAIENLKIRITPPTAANAGQDCAILVSGINAVIRNVVVSYDPLNSGNIGNLNQVAAIRDDVSADNTLVEACDIEAPSYTQLSVAGTFTGVQLTNTVIGFQPRIINTRIQGADRAISTTGKVDNCEIDSFFVLGVNATTGASVSRTTITSTNANTDGIVATSDARCDSCTIAVSRNGITCQSSAFIVNACRINGGQTGILLQNTSTNGVVTSNIVSGATTGIDDQGTGNIVANNKVI